MTAETIKLELEYIIMLLFGEINIKQIYLDRLSFHYDEKITDLIEVLSLSGTETHDKNAGSRGIYISSIIIKDSALFYDYNGTKLHIDNINLRMFSYLRMYYEALLSFSAFGEINSETFLYDLDLSFNIDNDFSKINIINPHHKNNIKLNKREPGRLHGTIDLINNSCDIHVSMPFPLQILSIPPVDIEGTAYIDGQVSNTIDYPDFKGNIYTKDLKVNDHEIYKYLHISKDSDEIHVSELKIESNILSLSSTGNLNLKHFLEKREFGSISFSIKDLDSNLFLSDIMDHQSCFFQNISLDGSLLLNFEQGVFSPDLSSSVNIRGQTGKYGPLNGILFVKYHNDLLTIQTKGIKIDNSLLSSNTAINFYNNTIEGTFNYIVNDPVEQHIFIKRLVACEILKGDEEDTRSFLNFWNNNIVTEGRGNIFGNITGNLSNPEIEGIINGKEISFCNTYLGDINSCIKFHNARIVLFDTELMIEGSSLTANGTINLGRNAEKLIEIIITADHYPINKVFNIYDIILEIGPDTLVSGIVKIDSIEDNILIYFDNAEAYDIYWENIPIGDLTGSGSFIDGVLNINWAKLYAQQGYIEGSGHIDLINDTYALSAEARDFSATIFDRIKSAANIDKFLLNADLKLKGCFDYLDIEANGTLHSIFINQHELFDIIFDISVLKNYGEYVIIFKDSKIEGNIKNLHETDFKGRIVFPDIIKFAGLFTESNFDELKAPLKGQLTGHIDFYHPQDLFAQLFMDKLHLEFPGSLFSNTDTIKIVYYNGQLIAKDFILASGKDSFSIRGLIDPEIGYDLNLQTNFCMSLALRFLPPELIYTFRGNADSYIDITGSIDTPILNGTIKIENGFLRLADVPYPFTNINGKFAIQGNEISINKLSSRFSQGIINSSGNFIISFKGIESIFMNFDGTNIFYAVPGLFDSRFNTVIQLTGNSHTGFIFSGDLGLNNFRYTEQINITGRLANMLTGFITGRATFEDHTTTVDDIVRLDIRVTGERNLSMDNDLGTIFFTADLNIRGSAENPVVLGRAEITRGTLLFLNHTFTDLSGNIEFTNPFKIDPNINISGRTYISGYNINISLTGSLENPVLNLTSNPSLPEIDIFSLLGTGKTTQDFLVQDSQARYGEFGITTLITSPVTGFLEKTARDFFRFDRITISPILSGSQADISAKVTVEKRLSSQLLLLYSFSTTYREEQVAILKYDLTNNLNAILQRSEFGSLGSDIQFNVSFD